MAAYPQQWPIAAHYFTQPIQLATVDSLWVENTLHVNIGIEGCVLPVSFGLESHLILNASRFTFARVLQMERQFRLKCVPYTYADLISRLWSRVCAIGNSIDRTFKRIGWFITGVTVFWGFIHLYGVVAVARTAKMKRDKER